MGWQDYDTARAKKRLIVLCDGTWMNSDYGYVKPGLFNGKGGLQVPSNVTRISRCFKRRCGDGTLQIINYESGVGSGSNMLDSVTGGAFGVGLAEVSLALQAFRARSSSGDEPPLTADSASASVRLPMRQLPRRRRNLSRGLLPGRIYCPLRRRHDCQSRPAHARGR